MKFCSDLSGVQILIELIVEAKSEKCAVSDMRTKALGATMTFRSQETFNRMPVHVTASLVSGAFANPGFAP